MKNKTRVAIFYDGNYLGRVARYYASNNIVNYRFNIDALHKYITEQLASVNEAYYLNASRYYRCRHTAKEAMHRKNQLFRDRYTDDLLCSLNIECKYTSYSATSNCGDDALLCNWLSLDILDSAKEAKLDMVVLVAASSSYLPVLNKLVSMGVDVMLVGWDVAMCADTAPDIKTCATLFSAAHHTVVVNSVLDNEPETIEGLLTAINSVRPITEEELSNDNDKIEVAQDIDFSENEDWEVSEIVTLKHSFGFVRYPDNNLFFSLSDYKGDFVTLKVGDSVEFVVGLSDDGQKVAKKVSKIESNLHLFDEEGGYSVSEEFIDWEY